MSEENVPRPRFWGFAANSDTRILQPLVRFAIGGKREFAMKKWSAVLLVACIGMLGALASSASGAANPDQAPCHAQFTSNVGPGGSLGPQMSANAQVDRPFGQIVVSGAAHLRSPCPE